MIFIKNNLSSRPPPRSAPRPPPRPAPRPPPSPAPRPTEPRQPSVRFRPDRPRQPELLRKVEEGNPQPPPLAGPTLKPYQLKPKRETNVELFLEPPIVEPPVEQAPPDPKKLKRMKKKLDELNRKIRHSRKKQDGLIHK